MCFSLCPPSMHSAAGTQLCLSHMSREGAALPGWEEAALHMPMPWDLDPKDEGLQLMDFS